MMEAKLKDSKVSIEFSKEEALVFLNWLFRFNENEQDKSNSFEDQSEERVLWDLESILETVMDSTLKSNYGEMVSQARAIVRDSDENL